MRRTATALGVTAVLLLGVLGAAGPPLRPRAR